MGAGAISELVQRYRHRIRTAPKTFVVGPGGRGISFASCGSFFGAESGH